MPAGGIIGRPLDWPESSLAGYATFKLPLHFPRALLFKRISATAHADAYEDEQNRRGLHLLILGSD
jgi:hypothetical protein